MANITEFKTVEGTNALEMVEKRSRFIGVVTHVEDVNAVNDFLDKLRKANKDAKHIAYAYSLGKDRAVSKIGSEAATMHGILAAFSYAAMGMACLFACMYLIQKRLLQKKMSNKFGALIPSIGLLYKALRASATSAFVFMFASILFAVAAIKPESADAAQIFKFSIGFAVFAIQGALCFAVKRRIFSEGKAALITLAATAICLLLLLAMELKKFII